MQKKPYSFILFCSRSLCNVSWNFSIKKLVEKGKIMFEIIFKKNLVKNDETRMCSKPETLMSKLQCSPEKKNDLKICNFFEFLQVVLTLVFFLVPDDVDVKEILRIRLRRKQVRLRFKSSPTPVSAHDLGLSLSSLCRNIQVERPFCSSRVGSTVVRDSTPIRG